jgi:GNAT superfamily N-acetyltransferase
MSIGGIGHGQKPADVSSFSTSLLGVSGSMTITGTPSIADFQAIFRALDQFNAPMVGYARFSPLAILLHDESGTVTGGLWGSTVYSWLTINMLFVPANLRGRGIGSTLIRSAEVEARVRGCVGMLVDTFSFQAQPFYERHGFTVFGVQKNLPPGYDCVHLHKALDCG